MQLSRTTHGAVIVGHRGAGRGSVATTGGEVVENTVASFQAAHAAGVSWIETDVMRTRDNALVLHHDTVLADGTAVLSLSAAEACERGLVELGEVFAELPPELGMIVEVKHVLDDAVTSGPTTAALVGEALLAERLRARRPLATYGFDPSTPLGLPRYLVPRGVLTGTIAEGGTDFSAMVVAASRMRTPLIAAHTSTLLGERAVRQMLPHSLEQVIAAAHSRGLLVLAWCPGLADATVLDAAGVDALCVDDVPTFMQHWRR